MQIIKKVSWQLGTNVTKCNILLTWYYYTQGIIQKRKKKKPQLVLVQGYLLLSIMKRYIYLYLYKHSKFPAAGEWLGLL